MNGASDVVLHGVESSHDIARWVDVQQRAAPCAPWGPNELAHWWGHVSDGSAVIAADGGRRALGIARVERSDWAPESRHSVAWVMVLPEHRRIGIGTALVGHVAEWTAARDLDGVDIVTSEASADALAFWTGRGLVEVGRDQRSRLDLAHRPEEVEPPAGVTLDVYDGREARERGMYAVALEAFPDIPGPEPYSPGDFEHWRDGDLRVPGLVADCSIVAMAGDRVIGYVLLVRNEVRPDVATHEMTAVARDWRGRGVASAMKRHQLGRAYDAGFRAFETENEARNAAILALNDRLGYRPLPAELTLRGSLEQLRVAAKRGPR